MIASTEFMHNLFWLPSILEVMMWMLITFHFVQQPNVLCNTTNLPLRDSLPLLHLQLWKKDNSLRPPPPIPCKKITQLTLVPKTISIKIKRYNTLITSVTYQCLPGSVGVRLVWGIADPCVTTNKQAANTAKR